MKPTGICYVNRQIAREVVSLLRKKKAMWISIHMNGVPLDHPTRLLRDGYPIWAIRTKGQIKHPILHLDIQPFDKSVSRSAPWDNCRFAVRHFHASFLARAINKTYGPGQMRIGVTLKALPECRRSGDDLKDPRLAVLGVLGASVPKQNFFTRSPSADDPRWRVVEDIVSNVRASDQNDSDFITMDDDMLELHDLASTNEEGERLSALEDWDEIIHSHKIVLASLKLTEEVFHKASPVHEIPEKDWEYVFGNLGPIIERLLVAEYHKGNKQAAKSWLRYALVLLKYARGEDGQQWARHFWRGGICFRLRAYEAAAYCFWQAQEFQRRLDPGDEMTVVEQELFSEKLLTLLEKLRSMYPDEEDPLIAAKTVYVNTPVNDDFLHECTYSL